MILHTLEFELPFFSLIFLIILSINYFSKKRVNLKENKCFNMILIFSLVEIILSTFIHFLCSINGYEKIINIFYDFVNYSNKVVTTSFVAIFVYFLYYILLISFPNIKNNAKKYDKYPLTLIIIFFAITFFTKIEIVPFENVINVKGSTPVLGYVFIAILLLVSFIVAINKKQNIDKRYSALFIIIPILLVGYVITILIPEMIIYDVIITIFSYILFFTIENPDLKLLEEVHRAKEISDNANEEKTLFLYNMTNDIRSITKDIDDSADYILDEIDNKKVDKEKVKDIARDIKSSTAKFTTMTNEILDISSIDTSSIKVYNNKYNIKLLLKQLVTNYKEKCHSKGLSFRSNIDTTLPEYLYGDSVSLKKVIDILLENSYKYTEKGYIELNVNTIIKNDVARLIITVEDSGTGMKIEELNKALNNKKEEDSTNLNNSLYNAKKLITLMNGTIVPSSTYGSGTSIKIILDQKVYEEKSKTSKYNKELDKKRILLVDDNIASQKLFTKILSNTNIELDIVSLGKECLDKIRNKEKYDLILLDEEMTPLSGIEVITKLKNIKNFNTGVILLTKNNDYEYNEDYLKYGFIDYILKPLDKNIVLDKISKY